MPRRRAVLHPLRQDRGARRRARGRARRRPRRPHRRRSGGRRRARPQPAVRRIRGHARHHHPGMAARPPAPARRAACRLPLPSFADGIEACRRILRSGATPAVLRLYDEFESLGGGRGGDGTKCTLIVLDEGDARARRGDDGGRRPVLCRRGREPATRLVDAWLRHRNDTSALQALTRQGYVVDTMEIAAPWSRLARLCSTTVRAALLAVPHAASASCHLSHSYPTARACTSRSSPSRRPTRSRRPTSPCGTPASAPSWPAAATCRTTTASASTGRGSWPTALGDGAGGARRRSSTPSIRTASSTPASSACRRRSGTRAVAVTTPATMRWDWTAIGAGAAVAWCSPCRWRSAPGSPPRATTRPRRRPLDRRDGRLRASAPAARRGCSAAGLR